MIKTMDAPLTTEERSWLEKLDTDAAVKPEAPPEIKRALVEKGLAIELVEGGMQLTKLGRERLSGSIITPAPAPWDRQ